MAVWIALKDGKVAEQILTEEGQDPMFSVDAEGAEFFEVDRVGDLAAELFDKDTGGWVDNPEHVAIIADIDAGAEHIAMVHIMKAMEARLILAGVPTEGLLAAEAERFGLDLVELARTVADKAAETVDKEMARREAKLSIR